MNQPEKYIGVITQLVEKKHEDGNPYFIGWIESPQISDRISFHQKSLINRKEISDLQEGIFILVQTKISSLPDKKDPNVFFERLDAINCTLNCEKIILKDITQ